MAAVFSTDASPSADAAVTAQFRVARGEYPTLAVLKQVPLLDEEALRLAMEKLAARRAGHTAGGGADGEPDGVDYTRYTTVDGEGTPSLSGEGHRCVARLGLFSGHPTDGKAPACEGALVGVPEPHRFHDGGEPCGSSDGGSRAAGLARVWNADAVVGEGGGEGRAARCGGQRECAAGCVRR
ncbi:putative serine/threonine protein kinase [Trypanosoma cruzi]|uniref:Putative serine/threonine protein kinase n=1 Tax=Trypanosoma cruzi TaxID=5693 RepID=A0A2V2VIH2_TRYCR|nr:putative serine/threonine protein kinase [Trypanosoma cruzi]